MDCGVYEIGGRHSTCRIVALRRNGSGAPIGVAYICTIGCKVEGVAGAIIGGRHASGTWNAIDAFSCRRWTCAKSTPASGDVGCEGFVFAVQIWFGVNSVSE